MNFLEQFGGAQLSTNAKSSALRTMKSGFAKLEDATVHTKTKDGVETYSVKVNFGALAKGEDGINDFIRTSRANELAKAINKYRYLFIHADKTDLLSSLPNPFVAYTQEVDVVQNEGTDQESVIKVTKPIEITDLKTELPALREMHGDELEFIFDNSNDDNKCYAVRVNEPKAYCEALCEIINKLKDTTYRLKITSGDRNFDQISNITKANL